MTKYDLVFVGGGLANSLIAYRLSEVRPDLRMLVIETGDRLGGNHTWSFHDSDLEAAQLTWLEPFITYRWAGYDVQFQNHYRSFSGQYCSITAERLHDRASAALGSSVMLGSQADTVQPDHIVLQTGERIDARAVIDGRGPVESEHLHLGFQKFVGREVQLDQPHGLRCPLLMDATVPQEGGYRFVYLLPFDERRILIEDTYYADDHGLDSETVRTRIGAYAQSKGWTIANVVREESGVLPIVLGGDIGKFWHEKTPGLPTVGLRGAFFHPTTGYSLPDAVRIADLISVQKDMGSAALSRLLRRHSMSQWRAHSFYRLLNRMLFLAADPPARHRIFRRFHKLSAGLVKRFYAGRSTIFDKARVLVGKPPIPITDALKVVLPAKTPPQNERGRQV